jgi:hypothetical protein
MCDCQVCTELRKLEEIKTSIPDEKDRVWFEDFIEKYMDICFDLDISEWNSREYMDYIAKFLGDEQHEKFKEWVRKEKGL